MGPLNGPAVHRLSFSHRKKFPKEGMERLARFKYYNGEGAVCSVSFFSLHGTYRIAMEGPVCFVTPTILKRRFRLRNHTNPSQNSVAFSSVVALLALSVGG